MFFLKKNSGPPLTFLWPGIVYASDKCNEWPLKALLFTHKGGKKYIVGWIFEPIFWRFSFYTYCSFIAFGNNHFKCAADDFFLILCSHSLLSLCCFCRPLYPAFIPSFLGENTHLSFLKCLAVHGIAMSCKAN